MPKNFPFRSDPGHGWLIVSPKDMKDIGLTEADISHYSYRKGDQIALEEDCDAATFITTYEKVNGERVQFVERDDGGEIRNWASYGTKAYEAV